MGRRLRLVSRGDGSSRREHLSTSFTGEDAGRARPVNTPPLNSPWTRGHGCVFLNCRYGENRHRRRSASWRHASWKIFRILLQKHFLLAPTAQKILLPGSRRAVRSLRRSFHHDSGPGGLGRHRGPTEDSSVNSLCVSPPQGAMRRVTLDSR